jgi:tetratricopeptide (TPR) repeat protein
MPDLQELYDDATVDFTMGEYDSAIAKYRQILEYDPNYFDAQVGLSMCHYRKGDFPTAIAEGHKAERLKPNEQLVHTNLSLFYMKSGDKKTAEHHGLQARISSWKGNMAAPDPNKPAADSELQMAQPAAPPMKVPEKFPDMPWKKKPPATGSGEKGGDPAQKS